jgi:hypothetical protein
MRESRPRRVLALLRTGAIILGLAATLLFLARMGYWAMFSTFPVYDDEGCILITIKAFMQGHALYDEVFSMYGPLPVLLKWMLFAFSGVPVGHDAGRLICLGYWLATAAVCGAIAWRLTGSVITGWAGIVFVFRALSLMVDQPGHPQELCGLLLALGVLLSTYAEAGPGRRSGAIFAGIGVVSGCLLMSKVNLFVFLMLALGAAALAFTTRTRPVAAAIALYQVGLLAAPELLMRQRLDIPPFRRFAVQVTLALVAVAILAFGRRARPFLTPRRYAWFAAGLVGSVGVIAAAVLLRGTTPRGLLDGVLLIPIRAGTQFFLPGAFSDGPWSIPAAFSVGALLWLVLERAGLATSTVPTLLSAVFRIAYCGHFLIWNRPDHIVPYQDLFAYAVPAAVLVLIPRDMTERSVGDAFARLVLALVAVTESLWAFPVAGSQQAFATFLPALILVIAVADGCRDLAALCARWAWWPTPIVRRLVPAAVVAILLPVLQVEAAASKARYQGGVPLGLPGAHAIRLDAKLVRYFQRLTEVLGESPGTFFTLPGTYSLYFWTDREPPTAMSLTNWMYILDDRQQERIVSELAAHPETQVVVSPRLIDFWMQGDPLPASPLVRYIDANFAPATQLEDAAIWARQDTPAEPGSPPRLWIARPK